MAGSQPSSASPRPQPHRRTSSTVSLGKAGAPNGARTKTGKAHAVGKHNRNRSFGRDLNKLARLASTGVAGNASSGTADDTSMRPTAMGRTTSNPGHTPASVAQHVKRNKSDVALPRAGSKVHIKKNQSAVTLKRNESQPKLKRNSRPTTPKEAKERAEEEERNKYVQPAFSIDTDEGEEEEDEWTEESASVSPVLTRHGSMKGSRPNLQTNGGRTSTATTTTGTTTLSRPDQDASADSPTTPTVEQKKPAKTEQPIPLNASASTSRLPDPTAITNRLLRKTSTQQLAPKLSTISAGGSSGTQSPHAESNGQMTSSQTWNSTPSGSSHPSVPSDGISRFLDPGVASSSGRNNYSAQIHSAMGQMHAQQGARTRSPSPNPTADQLRRARSAGHMSAADSAEARKKGAQVQIGGEHPDADKRTWTIDPSNYRRIGGNTQAKMDLWRTQSTVEPSTAPPAPLLRNSHGHGVEAQRYLGGEERRLRMAEEAENELAYLRIYRNPAIESVDRLKTVRRKKAEKNRKRASLENSQQHANGVPARQSSKGRPQSSQDTPNGSLGTTVAGSAGTPGRRSVRFSVGGGDEHDEDEEHEDVGESARLASLLRNLWIGGEADTASVD